jgi:hypothetical protein
LTFVSAVRPDVVICVINPTDSRELIRSTIETLRHFISFKVLFYAMTPWYRDFLASDDHYVSNYKTLSTEEYQQKIAEYESLLASPVIDIMNPINEKFILDSIQQALR